MLFQPIHAIALMHLYAIISQRAYTFHFYQPKSILELTYGISLYSLYTNSKYSGASC